MNKRSLLYAILIVLVFLGGLSVGTQRAMAGPSTNTDWVTHGTAWVPQSPTGFSYWHPFGWGMVAKSTAAADRWVHIPLTYGSVLNGINQQLVYVEFCAISTNGAATYPKQMDLWDGGTRFYSVTFTWWADNAYHCVNHTFTPAWRADIGMSVWLHFANNSDQITLYKAWVRTQQ